MEYWNTKSVKPLSEIVQQKAVSETFYNKAGV
mgnify:FL=1